ncbi:MAG: FAD-dependent oxidoreductase [Clostridia bacterium]|nr:FAD-dependent oxidoreductase [Clostridia bacterium]
MDYDVIVVGGGPAGVSTAIYLKRANVNVAIIEKSFIGGQVGRTSELENYAGFIDKDAFVFCENLKTQLKNLDIKVIRDTVIDIETEKIKKIIGKKGTYQCKVIILCIGADEIKLDLPNIDNFIGNGISYCAVCDGNFYKDKVVCVVGGGNTALEDAIYLSKIASEVHLIHRRDEYRAERFLVQAMEKLVNVPNPKIVLHKNTTVTQVLGQNSLEAVELNNVTTNEKTRLNTNGLFLCIGRKPKLEFLKGKIEITPSGYIKVSNNLETSVKGVFAGGDCIEKEVRQVVTAVSDGAILSRNVLKFLDEE